MNWAKLFVRLMATTCLLICVGCIGFGGYCVWMYNNISSNLPEPYVKQLKLPSVNNYDWIDSDLHNSLEQAPRMIVSEAKLVKDLAEGSYFGIYAATNEIHYWWAVGSNPLGIVRFKTVISFDANDVPEKVKSEWLSWSIHIDKEKEVVVFTPSATGTLVLAFISVMAGLIGLAVSLV